MKKFEENIRHEQYKVISFQFSTQCPNQINLSQTPGLNNSSLSHQCINFISIRENILAKPTKKQSNKLIFIPHVCTLFRNK